MRGKREICRFAGVEVRLIPAHAGKTFTPVRLVAPSWAHPRACGENLTGAFMYGSICWLIPAHAGKTRNTTVMLSKSRAHPRACGENVRVGELLEGSAGSSPRMRGKRRESIPLSVWVGLIPAHAGKTVVYTQAAQVSSAHPRACGENRTLDTKAVKKAGSSPRMRGKLGCGGGVYGVTGLIPAHAGKTANRAGCGTCRPAHPRACGENAPVNKKPFCSLGSSPRMRGKPAGGGYDCVASGLIPAHAGKTASLSCRTGRTKAHPRVCGENLAIQRRRRVSPGSSPRMRGKPGE